MIESSTINGLDVHALRQRMGYESPSLMDGLFGVGFDTPAPYGGSPTPGGLDIVLSQSPNGE